MVEPEPLIKIAVVGGESTGKSTLTRDLAAHYGVTFVDEFARHFLIPRGGKYPVEEQLDIIEGQMRWEAEGIAKARARGDRLLFCDTEPICTMLWSEHNFGEVRPGVMEYVEGEKRPRYDLYLLADFRDLPWELDDIRQSPRSRDWFEGRLIEELDKRGLPWRKVSGTRGARVAEAERWVDALM